VRRPRLGAKIVRGLRRVVEIADAVAEDYQDEGRTQEYDETSAACRFIDRLIWWFEARPAGVCDTSCQDEETP